jgi:hypothetical protein
MHKNAVKDIVFGGLQELSRNTRFYYYTSSGAGYCRWTDEGKEAVLDFMKEMTPLMRAAEEQDLDNRAKEMILKELKS